MIEHRLVTEDVCNDIESNLFFKIQNVEKKSIYEKNVIIIDQLNLLFSSFQEHEENKLN